MTDLLQDRKRSQSDVQAEVDRSTAHQTPSALPLDPRLVANIAPDEVIK